MYCCRLMFIYSNIFNERKKSSHFWQRQSYRIEIQENVILTRVRISLVATRSSQVCMCSHTHMFSLKTLAENKRKERDMFRCEMITSRSDVMDLHKHFLYVGSKREKVEVEVCACLRRVCSYIYIIANVCVCCVCCVIKTLQYSQLRTSSEYQ